MTYNPVNAAESYQAAETEATAIAARIFEALSATKYPERIDWGHVGDMAETRDELRAIADRMFSEGEYSPEANAL
jgi:hypothetical protein